MRAAETAMGAEVSKALGAPKIADLCAELADATGLTRKLVDSHAKYLRMEGLLPATPGGRGNVGGAPARSVDACILLCSLLAAENPLNCVSAAARVATFTFSHIEIRHIGVDGDRVWKLWNSPDDIAPLRQPFLLVLDSLIRSYRAHIPDPPNLKAALIGVTCHRLVPRAWIEGVVPASVAGGTLLARAVYCDPDHGEFWAREGLAVEKTSVVPATILRRLGEFLAQASRVAADGPTEPSIRIISLEEFFGEALHEGKTA